MAGHGGARVPSNPAAVSGPGALSRRTDGAQPVTDLPNAGYGENADFRGLQSAAPLPERSNPGAGGGGMDLASILGGITPMDAETANPDEPVTAGGVFGPGGGPEVLGMPMNLEDEARRDIEAMHPGLVQAMVRAAQQPDASRSLKRMVRKILANRPA